MRESVTTERTDKKWRMSIFTLYICLPDTFPKNIFRWERFYKMKNMFSLTQNVFFHHFTTISGSTDGREEWFSEAQIKGQWRKMFGKYWLSVSKWYFRGEMEYFCKESKIIFIRQNILGFLLVKRTNMWRSRLSEANTKLCMICENFFISEVFHINEIINL